MIDAVVLAVETLTPILPTGLGLYTGTAPIYAVVSEIETYDDHADNERSMEHTGVQVDIWQRLTRPDGVTMETQLALEGRGFRRTRRGGDTELVNGILWHRISIDYEYVQEVE